MEGSGVLKRRKPRAGGIGAVSGSKLHGVAGGSASAGRGLRHFAVRVCQVVRGHGTTTYQKVADELVAEAAADDKNVRRRVYDSLNVLLALGVVAREGKSVRWRGLSVGGSGGQRAASADNGALGAEVKELRRVVADKRRFLARTEEQYQHLRALVKRNAEADGSTDDEYGSLMRIMKTAEHGAGSSDDRLRFPFLVLSCGQETTVEMAEDDSARDITFTLDADFTILDDREVLRRLRFRPRLAAPNSHSVPLGVRLMAPATPSPFRPTRSAILPPLPATPPSLASTPRRALFPLPPQSPGSGTATWSGQSES